MAQAERRDGIREPEQARQLGSAEHSRERSREVVGRSDMVMRSQEILGSLEALANHWNLDALGDGPSQARTARQLVHGEDPWQSVEQGAGGQVSSQGRRIGNGDATVQGEVACVVQVYEVRLELDRDGLPLRHGGDRSVEELAEGLSAWGDLRSDACDQAEHRLARGVGARHRDRVQRQVLGTRSVLGGADEGDGPEPSGDDGIGLMVGHPENLTPVTGMSSQAGRST
jgi:hypothetical protein